MPGWVTAATILLVASPADGAASEVESARVGLGLALGIQPSPNVVCQSDGDVVGCSTFLPAWALRAQVTYALWPRLSLSLVGGAGTDLDMVETVSSEGGRGTRGRSLFDLVVRVRYDAGRAGRVWLGAEAGAALARDWFRDHDASGKQTARGAAAQLAPLVGLTVGIALARQGPFTLDVEGGARLTPFGDDPPDLRRGLDPHPGGGRKATEYGTRTWLWLGLGGRYGR